MEPYYDHAGITIYHGDAVAVTNGVTNELSLIGVSTNALLSAGRVDAEDGRARGARAR